MLLWALTGGAALAVGGGVYGLHRLAIATVRPPRTPPQTGPEAVEAPHRPVEFESDGFTLRGWLFEPDGAASRPLAILVHGWSSGADRLFGVASTLVARGYPALAFDIRDHGRSDPAPYTTIRQWRDDVTAAVRHAANELVYARRVLIGHSMGAASCVIAVADGAPADAVALVAGPADVLEVTADYLTEQGLPGRLLSILLLPFWRRLAGMPFGRLLPEARVREIDVPILLLHGDRDQRVPREHFDRMVDASGGTAIPIAEAGHSDLLSREETTQALLGLLADLEASAERAKALGGAE